MKTVLCILLACCLAIPTQAQVKRSNNAGLDSLKQGVKNLGQLFKKTNSIQVNITGVANSDARVLKFVQQVRQVPGVMRLKQHNATEGVQLDVGYKGTGKLFWQGLPEQARQYFNTVAITDSVIDLSGAIAKAKITSPAATVANKPAAGPGKAVEAAGDGLTKGAARLFANVKTRLNNSEKNLIFKLFDLKPAANGNQFVMEGGEEYPFDASVYPVDLNADGKEEIFIFFGNTYTSGATGSSIVAFFPDNKGGFTTQLGFPGTIPDVLTTSNNGYPDLLIGGPGFEFPVQRWNGKTYEYYRKVNDKDYGKLKKTSLEAVSKSYCSKL